MRSARKEKPGPNQVADSVTGHPQATTHPLAFLVGSRSGELVLHAHDDHRWVSLNDVEPFPSLRAEVQR